MYEPNLSIPDLTRKVPDILKINVDMDKITIHEIK